MNSFRNRLLITFLLVILLPLIALAFIVRYEMTGQLMVQYELQIETLSQTIESDLMRKSTDLKSGLVELRRAIVDDNAFRDAVLNADGNRSYLLDYGGEALRLTGFSMMQIQDENGRIVSSGHFRNEFDRLDPMLPSALDGASPPGELLPLVHVRTPEGPRFAIAALDSFRMGPRTFFMIAGFDVEEDFLIDLNTGDDVDISIRLPDGITLATGEAEGSETHDEPYIQRSQTIRFVTANRNLSDGTITVTNDLSSLHNLRSRLDRWFMMVFVAIGLLTMLLIFWNASRMSKPLVRLAEKTASLDLDNLEVDFQSSRSDEIGTLSAKLSELTDRLRMSLQNIRDAERRATVGDLARQVNHDVKNGLTPIRNIVHHLGEVAAGEPEKLTEVFIERSTALESSISYLEQLSANYERLSPRAERTSCDLSTIVLQVANEFRGMDASIITTRLAEHSNVLADPVSLRRIVENLVDNALDSLNKGRGEVTITTSDADKDDTNLVRLEVADTGEGINEDQQDKIFDDFYTTKERGTGLGLSIVRRLVMDLGGTISVESEVGAGTRFIVCLPLTEPGDSIHFPLQAK